MIRTSEKIDSESFFLKLFSHLALESLAEKGKNGELWGHLYFIHSSPGAGKTSILRVFQPTTLLALLRGHNQHKDLFNFMKGIDALNDDKINVLGVFLPIREYGSLAYSPLSSHQRQRIFNALLNARLTLALLKSILDFAGMTFPDGLAQIKCTYQDVNNHFKGLSLPCTGLDLYQWAVNIENQIAQAMDSFNPEDILGKEGHDEPFVFSCFHPTSFSLDQLALPKRFLFMMDDVHSLPLEQRKYIKQYLNTRRLPVSIWLAERLSALSPEENLGNQEGRDYGIINIERYWSRNPRQYRKLLSNIAETRASMSADDIEAFESYLQEQNQYLEGETTESVYENELKSLRTLTDHSVKYFPWYQYLEKKKESIYEKTVLCRLINILLHREQSRTQLSLDFESSSVEISQKLSNASSLKSSAAFFVARQHKLPYYTGFDNLVTISNYNIQQFLIFSAALFEHVLAQQLINRNEGLLTAPNQERVLKQVAQELWNNLPRLVNQKVVNFLRELTKYAEKESLRPTVPYAPGVTGFAITQNYRHELFDEKAHWLSNPVYVSLATVLSDCVAYNLLIPEEITQGTKGTRHTVYYLNRWLCIHFNLVVGFGGWRHRKLDDLIKWLK